eukprot:gi/632945565/ref/XP_007888131.1/ PREDICTED: CD63 antigen-like isoform X2 [Callorhinchus milii]
MTVINIHVPGFVIQVCVKMDLENGAVTLKVTLFLFNLLFLVLGIILMGIGVSIQLNLHDISLVVSKSTSGALAVLTITGVAVFFMAVFGIIAAWKESVTMMKVFLILMTLVLLMEITVEVLAYVFRSRVHKDLADGFEKAMAAYENEPKLRAMVDGLQIQFHCCGANNYTDWLKTMFGQVVPSSCYIRITEMSGRNTSSQTTTINTLVIGIVVSCSYIKILRENYIPDY